MGRVLLTLSALLLTCGYVTVSPTQDGRRGDSVVDAIVFPDGDDDGRRSVRLGARFSATTRDPDAVFFPDTDDHNSRREGGDSDSGVTETVQQVGKNIVGGDSDSGVTETVQQVGKNIVGGDSDSAVFTETHQPAVETLQQVGKNIVGGDFVTAVFTETHQPAVEPVQQVVSNPVGGGGSVNEATISNSSVSDRPDVASVEYEEDTGYDVIPDEYRVQGHDDTSFAERNGLVSRAAIVAPKRRSNKGRMVNGVYRTAV